jgi:hypothetical protein
VPILETLEDRVAPATFPVTSTADDGTAGTLRWAITQANADTDPSSVINFNIASSGVQTIQVGSSSSYPGQPLPTITHSVAIDGTSQGGYSGTPLIVLDGTQAGSGSNGLTLQAGNSTLKGLAIGDFSAGGIEITGISAAGDMITNDYLGTNAAGTEVVANGFGVEIDSGASQNVIGGLFGGVGNIISGNRGAGVEISGGGANSVEGNLIGTNAAGSPGLGNGTGVLITAASANNSIGFPGAGNTISGNANFGVSITSGSSLNQVQGNKIGTTPDGTAALGNGEGVVISNGAKNLIGGTAAGAGNTISGNSLVGAGVVIYGDDARLNLVQGNLIGTNAAGTAALENGFGVLISAGANSNTIGGTATGAGNTISGSQVGVQIINNGTTGNLVQGNLIGTNAAGTAALPNGTGVLIQAQAKGNTIGGTAVGAGNTISGNRMSGVRIANGGTTGNLVQGNKVGINAAGTAALANGTGVLIDSGANSNTVGGTAAGAANIVSGNTMAGVTITGSGTTGNLVQGNLIGTNPAGSPGLGNGTGVLIESGASSNTIGGTAANIIASNLGAAVQVGANGADSGTVGNLILANSIFGNGGLGIDLGGTGVPLPNSPGGPHTGPNDLQNYPVLDPYTSPGTLIGTLNSTPNSTFHVEFFANATADPSGHGQGRHFLGTLAVATGASGDGPFTFSYTPFPGEPFLTATATSINADGTLGDTSEFSASVNAALASASGTVSATATEAIPFTEVVATFTVGAPVSAAAGFTALIAWGDGSSSLGTILSTAVGFGVLGSHSYPEEGSDPVTVTVLDGASDSATASGTIAVADARLTAIPKTVNFTEATTGAQVVASFVDPDARAFSGQFTATISWGDGTPSSPGTVVADGSSFDVNGTHAYASRGSYPITVTINDLATSTIANSTAVVSPPALIGTPRGISVFGNLSFSGVVATFTDPDPRTNPAGYQATVYWPDNGTTSVVTPTGGNPFKVSGSHVFSAFAGTLTLKVVVVDLQTPGRSVSILSRVADPPASEMNQIYVTQLYADLLQRPPDDGGLMYWAGLLDHGVSRQQVTAGIVASPEYKSIEVRQLYRTLFHRDADPLGLQACTSFLLLGGTVEQVEASITASPEYFQVRGGGSNAGFLAALYQDALNRAVDPTGQAAFSQALAQGVSRQAVAAAVFGSEEYERDLVSGYYSRFLNRDADPFGLAAFSNALRQGLHDEAAIASITASDEYFAGLQLPLAS